MGPLSTLYMAYLTRYSDIESLPNNRDMVILMYSYSRHQISPIARKSRGLILYPLPTTLIMPREITPARYRNIEMYADIELDWTWPTA